MFRCVQVFHHAFATASGPEFKYVSLLTISSLFKWNKLLTQKVFQVTTETPTLVLRIMLQIKRDEFLKASLSKSKLRISRFTLGALMASGFGASIAFPWTSSLFLKILCLCRCTDEVEKSEIVFVINS